MTKSTETRYPLKKYLEEQIEGLKYDWAKNEVARRYNEEHDPENPSNQKQVDAATHNMAVLEEKITWMEQVLASLA